MLYIYARMCAHIGEYIIYILSFFGYFLSFLADMVLLKRFKRF